MPVSIVSKPDKTMFPQTDRPAQGQKKIKIRDEKLIKHRPV